MSTHRTRVAWWGAALGVTALALSTACSKVPPVQNDLHRLEMNVAQAQMAKGTVSHIDAIGVYHDLTSREVSEEAAWRSSDEKVAVVVGAGLVKGVGEGVATIRAEIGDLSAAAAVRVTPAQLTGLEMSLPSVSMPVGLTAQLNAIGRFTDLTTQDLTLQAEWSSSLPGVATVEKGLVAAVGTGAAVITARYGGQAATAAAVATPALVASIRIEPPNKTVPWGIPQQLEAWAHMTQGPDQKITSKVAWSSSAPGIADFRPGSPGMLDTNRNADCKKAGAGCEVMVTASLAYSNCTAGYACSTSTKLFVSSILVASIRIDPPSYSMPLATHRQFKAFGTFTDGQEYDVTQAAYWQVTNAAVASVANQPGGRGLVESLAVGTAKVAATMDGWAGDAPAPVKGEAALAVTDAALVDIRVSPDLFSCRECGKLPVGLTRQFKAYGTFAGLADEVEITQNVTWTTDAPDSAIVSNMYKGLVTAVRARDAAVDIIAICPRTNTTGSYALTIIPPQIMKLVLQPTQASRPKGIEQRFKAWATYTNNVTENFSASLSWEIVARPAGAEGDLEPATLFLSGTGPAAEAVFKSYQKTSLGAYTVQASNDPLTCPDCGFFAPQAKMTVNPAILQSLQIIPYESWAPPNVMPLMFHLPLKARGTYSDASTDDLTASAVWSLANRNPQDLTRYAQLVPNEPGVVDSLRATFDPQATPGPPTGFTVSAKAGEVPAALYDLDVAPYTLMAIEVKSIASADPGHVPDLSPHYNVPKGLGAEFRAYGDYGSYFTQAFIPIVEGHVLPNHKFDISHMAAWDAHNYVTAPQYPVVAAIQYHAGAASPHADATAIQLGFSTVSAEDALHTGDRGEVDLHVTNAVPVRIALAPAEASIPRGTTRDFVASVYYSDAPDTAVLNPSGIHFGLASCRPAPAICLPRNPPPECQSCLAPADVATITAESGRARGEGLGWVFVTASMTGCQPAPAGACDPTALLKVDVGQLRSIRIEPAGSAIALKSSVQLRAFGAFTDRPAEIDITAEVAWDSADHETVLVSNDGATKGVAIGLKMGGPVAVGATMKDPFSGDFIHGGASVTVTERVVTAIEVVAEVPPDAGTCPYQVEVGKTLQFRAHAHYSDGFVDPNVAVAWESSNSEVASIDAAGLATGVAPGEVDVHAHHLASGLAGNARLRVNCPEAACQPQVAAR